MPSERLIRAVLANIDSWVSAVDEIAFYANPGNKSRALHLKSNLLQSKVSFMRLTGASPAEIDDAMAQANRSTDWPGDDK